MAAILSRSQCVNLLTSATILFIIVMSHHQHHLKSSATLLRIQQIVQAKNKENIYAQHYWLFVRGIHKWLEDSSYKEPVIWKMFPSQGIIMYVSSKPDLCVINGSTATLLGLYSLRRHCLIGIGIPIINLRQLSDCLRFIMGIPVSIRCCLYSE